MFKSHNAWLPLLACLLGLSVLGHALLTGTIRGRGTLPPFVRNREPVGYWLSVFAVMLVTIAMGWLAVQ